MSETPQNTAQANLSRVAERLGALGLTNVVFVGGATISLFLTDHAAPKPRTTFDVDVVTPETSRVAYNALEQKLRDNGFIQPMGEGDPICRWLIEGVTVDIMPPDEAVLGFSNRWYPAIIEHAQQTTLPNGTTIWLVTTPYLIASKLEAFYSRGKGDYSFSHDLEDILIVLDGRRECLEEIRDAPNDVKSYVVTTFKVWLNDVEFKNSIVEHLSPDDASQARKSVILQRIKQISQLV